MAVPVKMGGGGGGWQAGLERGGGKRGGGVAGRMGGKMTPHVWPGLPPPALDHSQETGGACLQHYIIDGHIPLPPHCRAVQHARLRHRLQPSVLLLCYCYPE